MIKKIHFPLHAGTCVLFFASIFSYPYLNWKENLFLFFLACSCGIHRLFKREVFGSQNYFLIFLLIFLLSQFYLGYFHPENPKKWFPSISGWLALFALFLGALSLFHYLKNRTDGQPINTLDDLINRALPGILVVSIAMLSIFVLNIGEISPRKKVLPDYSLYMTIFFAFLLFYSIAYSLNHFTWRKIDKSMPYIALGVLIFLVGIGGVKTYQVYNAYRHALASKEASTGRDLSSVEGLWYEVMRQNRTPQIKFIDNKARVELAKINAEQGNLKEASNYYKEILTDETFNFEAHLGLAELASKTTDWKKAYEMYRKVLYLRPKEIDLYPNFIHVCIKSGNIDKAIEFIRDLQEARPITLSDAEDYLILGGAFLRKKDLQAASTYLRKGKEAMPHNYEAHFLLGRAYFESGKYADACEAFEKALQLNSNFEEGYYQLGIGYEYINQNLKAIDAFERLILIDHKNMKAFHHLKRLYARLGLKEKAFKMDNLMEKVSTKVIEVADWKGRSGENVYQNGDMYWAGTVSAPVFLKEGNTKFILQAQGTPAKGIWPHMVVKLDIKIIGEVDVTSKKLKDYEFKEAVKPGKYNLSISFTNDLCVVDKNGKMIEDRNLFVRSCWIVYEQ